MPLLSAFRDHGPCATPGEVPCEDWFSTFQGGYPVNARYTGTLDPVMMAQRDANVVADGYIDASINIQLLLHTMQH